MAQELVNNCLDIMEKPSIQDEAFKLLDIVIDAKWDTFSKLEKSIIQVTIRKRVMITFSDPMLLQIYLKTLSQEVTENERIARNVIENLIQMLKVSSYDCDLTYFIARSLVQLCHSSRTSMSVFAKLIPLLELPLADIVNHATVEPKLFPAVNELVNLVSLFYKELHQGLPSVVNFRLTYLRPEHFSIPKLFQF